MITAVAVVLCVKKFRTFIIFQNAHTEDSKKCDPWTKLAEHKQRVEEELTTLTDLRYAVIRPAIVYGLGDRHGLGLYI